MVGNGAEKLASMIWAGPHALLIAVCMFGMDINVPSRNTPPLMNAPTTEKSTAFGAARRGSLVSSASVDAVSKPSMTHNDMNIPSTKESVPARHDTPGPGEWG